VYLPIEIISGKFLLVIVRTQWQQRTIVRQHLPAIILRSTGTLLWVENLRTM
jgi:hypothetical protein